MSRISERGVTIVELFFWMAIATLMGVVILNFTLSASTGMAAMRSVSAAQSQAAQAVRSVLNDVRLANSGGVSSSGTVTTLTLQVPSMAATGGWLIPKDPGKVDTIEYTFDSSISNNPNQVLRRVVTPASGTGRPASSLVVATNLSPPAFTPLTPAGTIAPGLKVTVSARYDYKERWGGMQVFFSTLSGVAYYDRNRP